MRCGVLFEYAQVLMLDSILNYNESIQMNPFLFINIILAQ
jgi:hypothetical protein